MSCDMGIECRMLLESTSALFAMKRSIVENRMHPFVSEQLRTGTTFPCTFAAFEVTFLGWKNEGFSEFFGENLG